MWLGIDIGGTKVALALGDARGVLQASLKRPTEASGEPFRDLARIAADAQALLAREGLRAADLEGVGVAAPGPLDRDRGAVVCPPNLPGWDDVPVRDVLAEILGVGVTLENDANAAALAEWRFGAGQGARDLVYLTMSTGVGAGLILDGRLHRGASGNAGELGHVPVEWDGIRCRCGLHGCLEAYVGGLAWAGHLGRPPEEVVAAARRGDAAARAETERWCDYVARGIATLAFTLAPEVVVLGTIAVALGEELCFARLGAVLDERLWPVVRRDLRVVPAALGGESAGLAGICAALQASEEAASPGAS